MSFIFRPTFLVVGAFSLFVSVGAEGGRPFTETEPEPGRLTLLRPATDNPTDQLAHADALREAGRRRRAQRQYRALVRYWPSSPEAAIGQFRFAEMLDERGKEQRAFDAYERLLQEYPGVYPHDEVLARKFELAERVRARRRAQFLIFPGFQAPERALPMLESLLKQGPQWEYAPAAQLMMATIQEELDRLDDALLSYERVEVRYPRSPEAKTAALGRVRVMHALALDYPRHLDGVEHALQIAALFQQRHPDSPHMDEVSDWMDDLQDILAEAAFKKARYYDRIARHRTAALIAYERFLERYPETEWSDEARERLHELQELAKVDHES